jgi:hypothetical protein
MSQPSEQENNKNTPKLWTCSEDKAFESSLAWYLEDIGQWEKLAALTRRSPTEVEEQYQVLVYDIALYWGWSCPIAILFRWLHLTQFIKTDAIKAHPHQNRKKCKNIKGLSNYSLDPYKKKFNQQELMYLIWILSQIYQLSLT